MKHIYEGYLEGGDGITKNPLYNSYTSTHPQTLVTTADIFDGFTGFHMRSSNSWMKPI